MKSGFESFGGGTKKNLAGSASSQKETAPIPDVADALAEADPTKYSALPPKEEMTDVGPASDLHHYRIVQSSEGDRYVGLAKRDKGSLVLEQVVARMLKGIVNVSDVVAQQSEDGPAYYSRVMPMERIEKKTPFAEIQADRAVLGLVFNDWDHHLTEDDPSDPVPDWNIRRESGKATYYDFGRVRDFYETQHETIKEAVLTLDSLSPDILVLLKAKLQTLKARVEGEEGLGFVRSVVKDSGANLTSAFTPSLKQKSPETFRNLVLERIEDALERLAQIEGTERYQKAA